jgi:hypothetical protein
MNNLITLCARAKLLDLIKKHESRQGVQVACVYLSRDIDGLISLEFSCQDADYCKNSHYEVLISTTPMVYTDLQTFKHLTDHCIDYEYKSECFCIARGNSE